MLHYNLERGHGDGIRENVLLCKAFGMSREQIIDGFVWSSIYAGVEALGLAHEVAGDIVRAMPN